MKEISRSVKLDSTLKMKKLFLIYHTIIHLRPIQIRYQLWYRLRAQWRKITRFKYPLSIKREGTPVKLQAWIEKPVSYQNGTFTFLNQSETNPSFGLVLSGGNKRGALWAYNLNYMDYLLQPDMDKETGLELINDFIKNLPNNPTATEPYPIALRGINWIKFLSKYAILNTQYSSSLYAQYQIIYDNIEYHLLANHLLEDGFSLLFGAFYFADEKLYKIANEILTKELNEQILDDGAHFELSPMYHQIILDRLLDCINLVQNNQRFETQDSLLDLMRQQAQKMLGWLNQITFKNGQIPLLNDSVPGIAPTTEQLNAYASSFNFQLSAFNSKPVTLSEVEGCNLQLSNYASSLNFKHSTLNFKLGASGYRRFNGTNYECILDIGPIGPSYQPGHAHADTFNFVLNVNNNPLIVDTGISTYEANKTRLLERGTAAHNTVTVHDKNSSEVWSSFRVARRARVKILTDTSKKIVAEHNGFRAASTIHHREWEFADNSILITDTLKGIIIAGKAHFWISPDLNPIHIDNTIKVANTTFTFENAELIRLFPTQIPNGYNQFSENHKIEITFKNYLKTIITLR